MPKELTLTVYPDRQKVAQLAISCSGTPTFDASAMVHPALGDDKNPAVGTYRLVESRHPTSEDERYLYGSTILLFEKVDPGHRTLLALHGRQPLDDASFMHPTDGGVGLTDSALGAVRRYVEACDDEVTLEIVMAAAWWPSGWFRPKLAIGPLSKSALTARSNQSKPPSLRKAVYVGNRRYDDDCRGMPLWLEILLLSEMTNHPASSSGFGNGGASGGAGASDSFAPELIRHGRVVEREEGHLTDRIYRQKPAYQPHPSPNSRAFAATAPLIVDPFEEPVAVGAVAVAIAAVTDPLLSEMLSDQEPPLEGFGGGGASGGAGATDDWGTDAPLVDSTSETSVAESAPDAEKDQSADVSNDTSY
jgi:hypothetical protein